MFAVEVHRILFEVFGISTGVVPQQREIPIEQIYNTI